MGMPITPKSRAGKWAAEFSIVFIILMSLKIMRELPIPTFLIAFLGFAGFINGLIAIIRNKDRALLTLLSIPVGLVIIIWSALEMMFPH
ncbi:hypothetical protein EAL2_808p04400 (plasmid) [Peptoclostridium acidaminophilum DSM 3953]|uniref:Uncharacterized protein n=1 Tax=Peptoclostridium acidaminophilum DSM 3953 TaxID=1286171 RepID=W8T8A8_PEPAC|nr:hypothetical protein [Peptoclostridium acidaminophilum]AHM57944.1 hypothetical protein EAL2_808p04400 [Peptoclostridium acidaminophilum DSM 3953]